MKKNFKDPLISRVIMIITIIFLILLCLDLINITNYIPFTKGLTKGYDWFSLIGGLIGSTIGGIITYKGVKMTIDNQNMTDSEKSRFSIIPILDYKISYNQDDFDNSKGQLAGEDCDCISLEGVDIVTDKTEEWLFDIKVTNIGFGHAQIMGIDINVLDNENQESVGNQSIKYEYRLVRKDDKQDFLFIIYAPYNKIYKDGVPIERIYIVEIVVFYQDLLGNKYNQKIHSSIAKSVSKIDGKIIDHGNYAWMHYYEKFNYLSKK